MELIAAPPEYNHQHVGDRNHNYHKRNSEYHQEIKKKQVAAIYASSSPRIVSIDRYRNHI